MDPDQRTLSTLHTYSEIYRNLSTRKWRYTQAEHEDSLDKLELLIAELVDTLPKGQVA